MFGEEIVAHINFFSLVSSCTFRDVPHSRFRCGYPKQCFPNLLKMLHLALPQIYTRVFYLWKTIDLNRFWVGDSRPYQLSFLSEVLAPYEMRHTHVLGGRILTNASLTF